MGEVKPLVTLITHTPEPEKVIACAAKLCYSQKSGKVLDYDMTLEEAREFLDRLPNNHGTPYEHATFTFSIEGVSRALSHELVRHRMANHNQRSQRYVMESGFNYVIPEEIKDNTHIAVPSDDNDNCFDVDVNVTVEELFEQSMKSAKIYYDVLLKALKKSGVPEKIAFENARYVLPNACETKNMLTMNVRELHHFFNQRCCSRALPEMREVANQMLRICKGISPVLFKNAGPFCVSGACPEANMSCGKQKEMKQFYDDLYDMDGEVIF